jgi:ferredoxin
MRVRLSKIECDARSIARAARAPRLAISRGRVSPSPGAPQPPPEADSSVAAESPDRARDASSAATQAAPSPAAPDETVDAGAPPRPQPGPIVVREVVFADSGVTVTLDEGETILEAGLAAGLELDFSCSLGGCASCMLVVEEGEVFYEDRGAICLDDDEIEAGLCLPCVGRPAGRVVVLA